MLRSEEPNCAKSHVRPSCPPKSAWHVVHDTYDASWAVLTIAPGTSWPTVHRRRAGSPQSFWCRHFCPALGPLAQVTYGSLKSGAAWSSPTSFGTLASRADVRKRILPSRIAGGVGSPLMPLQTPLAQSAPLRHEAPSFPPPTQRPVIVDTTLLMTSGMQLAETTHGPFVPHSASVVQLAPPGWLQNPLVALQSLSVAHVALASPEHRRFAGLPPGSSGRPVARATTLRAR